MSTTPEGRVKAKVKDYLDSLAPYVRYYMPVPSRISKAGEPDFDVCFFGRWLSIECKATHKEKPTPLQVATMGQICAAQGVSLVIDADNVGTQLTWLNNWKAVIQTENRISTDAFPFGSISRPITTAIIR